MIVYVDVLIFINLIIDYFLLLVTSKITRSQTRKRWMLLAAFIGGVYSLILYVDLSFWLSTLLNVFCALVMTFITFKFGSVKKYIKNFGVFYGVTLIYGGVIFALWYFLKLSGIVISNGIVYLDISPLVLIISVVACYLAITLFYKIIERRYDNTQTVDIEISLDNKTVKLKALIDTGNALKEKFSGYPVVIVCVNDLLTLIPLKALPGFLSEGSAIPLGMENNFRLIPYSVVGGGGLLPAFKPDLLIINKDKTDILIHNVFIAINSKKISDSYSAIIGTDLLNCGSDSIANTNKIRKQSGTTNDMDRNETAVRR